MTANIGRDVPEDYPAVALRRFFWPISNGTTRAALAIISDGSRVLAQVVGMARRDGPLVPVIWAEIDVTELLREVPESAASCEVRDTVVPWSDSDGTLNVAAGDLIVWRGQWDQVEWLALSDARMEDERLVLFTLRCDSGPEGFGLRQAYPHDLVAVRRYAEE